MTRGITASQFSKNRTVKGKYVSAAKQILAVFDQSGGCKITGWARRGEVVDAGVDQSMNPKFDPQSKVASGKLTFHITLLTPMVPLNIHDQDRLGFDPANCK